ncbi:Alpha-soluble NSF attachment protein 2 [Striga hermonthica]|uniref:Alpha-soluble NSF attachment protein 2 n=1 Tax=Striga hermonthica TaxID=68872 RepID=A0A9N7RPY3_STRHE|nr:Alpha-soluble NSF attachment protein 2 [Striga hermonthica]
MDDNLAMAADFESRAEKKLAGWSLFGSKYEDAAELFDKAASAYKLAKSWNQAGAVYVKLASCHLKLDSKHEAANAYADAAYCYNKSNTKESISCLEDPIDLVMDIGRLNTCAKYYKEVAELYEQEQNLEQAIVYYKKVVDLFQSEDVTASANEYKQKVAQYPKAIKIYEDIAQQSLTDGLLKYCVKGHLLNAGFCQLCKNDDGAINNASDRYQHKKQSNVKSQAKHFSMKNNKSMGDHLAKAADLESQAEKKLAGWNLSGTKYEDAISLFKKAAIVYKLAKSWDQAGAVYVKLASCYLKLHLDRRLEAANAYADAARCYKKSNTKESISCLKESANLFMDMWRLDSCAYYCKEIAKLYEQEQNLEQAIVYYEKAADLFQSVHATSSAIGCQEKVAQCSAQLKQLNLSALSLHD